MGVQQRCITRGLRWESLCGYNFKYYKNPATGCDTHQPDSRVVINAEAHTNSVHVEDFDGDEYGYTPAQLDLEAQLSGKSSLSLVAHPKASSFKTPDVSRGGSSLTWYQLLLACTSVHGYSLKDKKDLSMHVDHIREIIWNESAFPSLILPQETKDLILAFAQSQLKTTQSFDDVIKGKGKGVIILLVSHPMDFRVSETWRKLTLPQTERPPRSWQNTHSRSGG